MSTNNLIGRKCKVDPNNCGTCIKNQSDFDVILDCRNCELKNKEYTICDIITSFWGTKVIVQDDKGKLSQVGINRVTVLKEEI